MIPIIALTTLILFATAQSLFAIVTPLNEHEKPHSLWEYRTAPMWNGRSLDDYENHRVNSDNSGELQNEQQALINPTNPDNMVAVWRDFRFGYRRVGFGYSMDGGEAWTDDLFPQMYHPWQSDPVLVVDENGVFTANVISYVQTSDSNGLLQISSYDGGVTWQDSVWASHITDGSAFEDKQMLAVDTCLASPYYGTFYCSWTRFPSESGTEIKLVRKRPGEPYDPPVQLSSETGVQWSNVATGPNGEVYVSWVSYSQSGILFVQSLDGGETFTPEVVIRSTSFAGANIIPDLLVFSYGVMAVDRTNGPFHNRIYMVFTDSDVDLIQTDVFFMYSDNRGDSWSNPLILNDDNSEFPCDQFHPWVCVDDTGRVWVEFYDRRNDPNNLLMDVYFTISEDGGASWRENERITEVSSDPTPGSLDAGLIGEYIGWSARNGEALAVWTDTRLGNQDTYSAIVDSIYIESSVHDPFSPSPITYSLSAFPNPFNPSTTISFSVSVPNIYSISVFDISGRVVNKLFRGHIENTQTISFNAVSLPSGVYLARLEDSAGRGLATTKLLLLK